MKNLLFLLLILYSLNNLFCQSMIVGGNEANVYIINDVKLSAAQNNVSQSTTGTGNLGILFRSKYLYGSVTFNIINKNEKLSTTDSTNVKLFSNNLLIPENSGQGINSFNIMLGLKSFSDYDENEKWEDLSLLSWKRVGFYVIWQANNTIWEKDSVTTSISINSPGIYATYSLLNLEIQNEEKDKIYLSAFGGFQARFLGGDYGLAGNTKLREHFLNLKNDKTSFFSTTFGFKLELGKFFGKIQESYFWGKDDIPGFSGWQTVISLGASIDLNLNAKTIGPAVK